jgi:hypothetical protein
MIARIWHGRTKREDFEKVKYYPEDTKYLLEFEEKVTHFEVFTE